MSTDAGKGALAGLHALITGAGTGIGRGIALAFARAGARVTLSGRRAAVLEEAAAEVRALGAECSVAPADVSKPEDCQRLASTAAASPGGLQILVNNAGIARFGALQDMSDADVLNIVNTNFTGAMLLAKHCIPHLARNKERGNATILNIGTSATAQPIKNFSVYSAAKAGLEFLTLSLAHDLAEYRIRANCISPGVVDTPIFSTTMPAAAVPKALAAFTAQTPLGRIGQPSDIAAAALFLCDPSNDWITGARLVVDGGISLT